MSEVTKIYCSGCGSPYDIPDHLLGSKIQCANCLVKFMVHKGGDIELLDTGDSFPEDSNTTKLSGMYSSGKNELVESSQHHIYFADQRDMILRGVIGKGGMGVVYRVCQPHLKRDIAVKMVPPEKIAEDSEAKHSFYQEAIITANLNHPNIVAVYDLGRTEDGTVFYTMKEVEGVPWEEVLDKKSVRENIDILQKVCDAVAFAHSKGIIHRDIKPTNVMLGHFGEVILMDWGLALKVRDEEGLEEIDSVKSIKTIAGSPSFMSPEMANTDISKIGLCSDIYLLGGILFLIVTGEVPHPAKDLYDAIEDAKNNKIHQSEKRGVLVDVALKALKTNPDDRYVDVKEFQKAIRDALKSMESFRFINLAREDLQKGKDTGEYDCFAQALFGFREAKNLSEGNPDADKGICEASLAYAQCAYEKGDYDLALSLLDENNEEMQPLLSQVERAIQHRTSRKRTVMILSIAAVLLVLIVIAGLTVAFLTIRHEQQQTLIAKRESEDSARLAVSESMKAIKEKKAAEVAKKNAEEALEKMKIARQKEAEATRNAKQASKRANIALRKAKVALYRMKKAQSSEHAAKVAVKKLTDTNKKLIDTHKETVELDLKRRTALLKSICVDICTEKYSGALKKLTLSPEKDSWKELLKIIRDLNRFDSVILNNARKKIGSQQIVKYREKNQLATIKNVKKRHIHYEITSGKVKIGVKLSPESLSMKVQRKYFPNINEIALKIRNKKFSSAKNPEKLFNYFVENLSELSTFYD